ncbi:hypothetical protein [Sandarakinorhabdus sp. AAP62]|nr:hypothetical protein [Sandarakinorhabdus sp. AAP62]
MTITTLENTSRPQTARRTLTPYYGNREHRRSPVLTRSELRQLVLDQLG